MRPTRTVSGMQDVAGNRAVAHLVAQRHEVATTGIHHRHTHAELFDPPGTTLEDFYQSTRTQADWFVEPSIKPDRGDLHALIRRATNPIAMKGAGNLNLADVRPLSDAEWTSIEAFGRAASGASTVRILSTSPYTVAQRKSIGDTLLALEAVIPPQVLRRSVSEAQLVDVDSGALVPKIAAYWTDFQPHLEMGYQAGAGARAEEFEAVLNLVKGVGHAMFAPLAGRVRNLHRFSVSMLTKLMFNFADITRTRPLHLVLFTGHDRPGAFIQSASLFEDLIVNSPNNVLMLEGQASLAAVTARIPALAASHGQPDAGGTHRIAQVMIAGHGEARSVELAGTGAPDAAGHYPSESLDLDNNAVQTQALIDALLTNLDPATARVVFAGCLVGSNPVPKGANAAQMSAHIATVPSLATFTQQRATALGMGPGFTTQAARASVGLSGAASLRDASGNLNINHPDDPTAFGSAAGYVSTGHEPTGLFRAAVEVALATTPVNAENLLRIRLAAGVTSSDRWWDECLIALLKVALAPVAVGAGIGAERLNGFAHLADTPFLGRFGTNFGITSSHWRSNINSHPDAAAIYREIVATPTMGAPSSEDERVGRFHLEQGWLALPEPARVGPLIAFLDGLPPGMTAGVLQDQLDPGPIGAHSASLFAAGAPTTSGRLRLALAWLFADPANADVTAYLDAQVLTPASGPELSPIVRAQLGGLTEDDVLDKLGRLVATAPGGGGGPELPAANAEVRGTGDNRVLVSQEPYPATVIPHVLQVRDLPGMHGKPFVWVPRGAVLDVVGFTHDWAAVDVTDRTGTAKLGFVHRSRITPP